MSLNIISNESSHTSMSPHPRSPRAPRKGKREVFSEANVYSTINARTKIFSKIQCPDMKNFVEELIANIDKNKYPEIIKDLKKIINELEKRSNYSKTLLRLSTVTEKNPIILHLKKLDTQAIDRLKGVRTYPTKFLIQV